MELVALQVPQGWEVRFNHFYDVTTEEKLSGDFLDYPFYEDILYMENISWMVAIDLGWLPDGDPDGSYTLHLIKLKVAQVIEPPVKKKISRKVGDLRIEYRLVEETTWEDTSIEIFRSRDIIKVQRKLNEFLQYKGV